MGIKIVENIEWRQQHKLYAGMERANTVENAEWFGEKSDKQNEYLDKFDKTDKDGDGVISKKEIRNYQIKKGLKTAGCVIAAALAIYGGVKLFKYIKMSPTERDINRLVKTNKKHYIESMMRKNSAPNQNMIDKMDDLGKSTLQNYNEACAKLPKGYKMQIISLESSANSQVYTHLSHKSFGTQYVDYNWSGHGDNLYTSSLFNSYCLSSRAKEFNPTEEYFTKVISNIRDNIEFNRYTTSKKLAKDITTLEKYAPKELIASSVKEFKTVLQGLKNNESSINIAKQMLRNI